MLFLSCTRAQIQFNADSTTGYCAASACSLDECCKETGDAELAQAAKQLSEQKQNVNDAKQAVRKAQLMKDLAAARFCSGSLSSHDSAQM